MLYRKTDHYEIHLGSNLDVLPTLADNSIDAIVTDPPYEIGFMGRSWDSSGIAYSVELWRECLRVLKPGGHLLAFGATRTYHRLAVAIEDAGFEIRDSIAWISNKTFPKSLDISKAIDKMAGAEREVLGTYAGARQKGSASWNGEDRTAGKGSGFGEVVSITAPATDEARKWEGWGTALKPVFEPVVVGRKPLEGTVAANVLQYGTGGLNIDASRVGDEEITINTFDNGAKPFGGAEGEPYTAKKVVGRWPANVVLHEDAADSLGAVSNFFYAARASKADRNEGLDLLPEQRSQHNSGGLGRRTSVDARLAEDGVNAPTAKNIHPTVKPTDLMRYLIKLVTPPGGTVLDVFTGSGTTGKAAILDGYQFVGIELTEDYLPIIEARLDHAVKAKDIVGEATLF